MSNWDKRPHMATSFPDPYPLIGHAYHFFSNPVGFYDRCRTADSDVLRIEFGPKTFYYITSPAVIEDILVRDTDQFKRVNLSKT